MSTYSREGENWLNSKICPVCGKEFHVLYPQAWGYKRNTGKNKLYYCSWSCMRKEETERNEMKKLTLEQKKKAVQIAVDGGNPLGFLESLGIRNSAEAWGKIKNHLKEYDPDTYAKLPKRLPQRTRTVSAPAVRTAEEPKPETVELVYDPGIEEEYRAKHEKTPEASPDVEARYSGDPMEYETSAIRVKGLGEFYFDKKYNTIDWRTPDGAETSLTPEGWRHLHDSIPEMLSVLHANFEEVKQE